MLHNVVYCLRSDRKEPCPACLFYPSMVLSLPTASNCTIAAGLLLNLHLIYLPSCYYMVWLQLHVSGILSPHCLPDVAMLLLRLTSEVTVRATNRTLAMTLRRSLQMMLPP